ncbi:MAG: hypothetical protein OEY28_00600 [Nitrospira sp.]|nr:hypothetical protein [Nitrospira sp.]
MRRRYRFLQGFTLILAVLSLWPSPGWTADLGSQNPPPFKEKDLLAYKGKGRSTLTGQVFLVSSSGKAITQAGVPVHLIPVTPFTRYRFDHHIRTTSCLSPDDETQNENAEPTRHPADCAETALAQLLDEKRLLPYLRTTRANPTGHFWFTKIPAGRYYILSLIDGRTGSRQGERAAGIAWLTIDLEAGEKASNVVVTDCRGHFC